MNWDVRRFDKIDSTNRYLLEEAANGAHSGLVAVARHQTAGRGRRGRTWDSKPDASLLVSALFRPSDGVAQVRYAQAMGLAISDAAKLVGAFDAKLKWPNDVLAESETSPGLRKLAGVLAEANEDALVVGAGVNLNWAGEMSESLKETAVSADELAGHPIDESQFLETLLASLSERLARPTWIPEAYRQRCVTVGMEVRVEQLTNTFTGKAESITDDGALVVRTDDGEAREVTIGDVVHLRPVS